MTAKTPIKEKVLTHEATVTIKPANGNPVKIVYRFADRAEAASFVGRARMMRGRAGVHGDRIMDVQLSEYRDTLYGDASSAYLDMLTVASFR